MHVFSSSRTRKREIDRQTDRQRVRETETETKTETEFVCWLLNVSATCECISATDLPGQFYVLPH